MTHHGLTVTVGQVRQSRVYYCSDADRDRFMAAAAATMEGVVTRPTGDPVPLEKSSATRQAGGWSPRQQAAARTLADLWRQALPLRGFPGGYAGGGKGRGEMSEEQAAACQAAWTEYRDTMDAVYARCSPRHEHWLRQAVVYADAVPLGAAHLVREALDWLADEWGIDMLGRKKR